MDDRPGARDGSDVARAVTGEAREGERHGARGDGDRARVS